MRHDIPSRGSGSGAGGNPAIAGILLSSQMRALMRERAEIAQAIYRDIVAKRTGRLARSARVETRIGGRQKDRWVGVLTIGGSEAPHGLPHEFGTDDGDTNVQAAAHDLNQVLNMLGTL